MAIKAARDAINQRPNTPGHFLFVGTGAHRGLVSELTARRNQAFAGASSRLYPVLGSDYVTHLYDRMQAEQLGPLPSQKAAVEAFDVRGHRPEELKKAMNGLVSDFPLGDDVDQVFEVIVQTGKTAAPDVDIHTRENLGALAEAIFHRLAAPVSGAKGVFSADAAAEYGKAVGRPVHIEQIQPVANALLAANLRTAHGAPGPGVRDHRPVCPASMQGAYPDQRIISPTNRRRLVAEAAGLVTHPATKNEEQTLMANAKTATPKPIKAPLNRTALIADIVEQTDLPAKDVKATLMALESTIVRSLSKKGAGEFTLPGLLKIATVKVPAKPKRKGINPFTKLEQVFAAKPASVKIKVRALKKLKDATA